jgi:homoserine kinase
MVAAAIVGSAVVGAGASLAGSKAQSKAAQKAAETQERMYKQTRADLLPYNTAGQSAVNNLTTNMAKYTAPVKMDEAQLRRTPGYQFNLQQGLKSVQNAAAARGLGNSGAALKGAAAYATGLADSTYQNQFNNQVTNTTNAYNRLMGVGQLGENAAAQTGDYGTRTASNIGNNLIQGGTAQAAGYVGAANSLNNGVNSMLSYNALKKGLYNG